MRTNREGNLKRFFDIKDTDLVLDVHGEALALREAEYDYIFWNPSEAEGKEICAQNLFGLLGPEGTLVIYFDNPVSVHAFATGMKETGDLNLGYPLLTELKEAVAKNGAVFCDKLYYPYPGVEFPCAFFSDQRLPGKNECDDNFYHFDAARMEAFEERSITDRIVSGGMYPYLANAYMLVLSKEQAREWPVYTRFSNERRKEAQIRTDLYKDRVTKRAADKEAEHHVLSMEKTAPRLKECLEGISVLGRACELNEILAVRADEKSVSFSFVKGESLEQTLDYMLEEGKEEEVKAVLLSFGDSLRAAAGASEFVMTDAFREIFGEVEQWETYQFHTLSVSDIDLVCQNILLSDKAVVIDYEWTFDFPVPVEFLVFRFLYFYLEAKNRTCMENKAFKDIYERAGISEEMREVFLAMETAFQRYVQSGAKVLCNSFDKEGKPVLTCAEIAKQVEDLNGKTVGGHAAKRSPEGVYLYKLSEATDGMQILLDGFDATGGARVLRLGAMAERGGVHEGLFFETNGMHLGGLLYLFENEIPQITLRGCEGGDDGAEISVEEIVMSEAAVRELKTTIADMRFIIDNREQQIRDLKNSASWKVTKPLRALKGNKEE